MLRSTFVHAQGIGYATEQKLWAMGATTWEDFMELATDLRIPEGRKRILTPVVEESLERLEAGDHRYFARVLAPKDHWRALSDFGDRIAFLDIETTGCDHHDDITVIGVYDGFEMRSYIQGVNLLDFPADISRYRMLVTFFGSGFDLPFIRRRFPDLKLDHLHIDLCHLLRRLGLSGGLKHIETELGVRRIPETEGLNGLDAVRLWSRYRRGDDDALRLLLLYNKEDVVNMQFILRVACDRMLTAIDPPGEIADSIRRML